MSQFYLSPFVLDKCGSSDYTKRFTVVSIESGSVGHALPNWVVHLRLADTSIQSANNDTGCCLCPATTKRCQALQWSGKSRFLDTAERLQHFSTERKQFCFLTVYNQRWYWRANEPPNFIRKFLINCEPVQDTATSVLKRKFKKTVKYLEKT
jgi:hypothetical protein